MYNTTPVPTVPQSPLSPAPCSQPSPLLALVCAALAGSYQSSWLSASVAELARSQGIAPPRLSELKNRLLPSFEQLLQQSRRRGRRARPLDPQTGDRVPEALLAVAADVIREVPIRRRAVQQRLVAAADRLRRESGVLQKTFCQRLGLSPRTFRHWKRQTSTITKVIPLQVPEPAAEKKPRRRNRGRFALEVTLPGVQMMADTTELSLFGVPLQMLALQDPGDRYRHLLDRAQVELEQTALQVAQLVRNTPPGFQLLTDQGTPYRAQAAQQAYDQLELEHQTQKEATPTEKATLERAFRTLKDALRPLITLSNRLATQIPQLAQPTVARPLAQMLVHALLQVYHQSRLHLRHPREGIDRKELDDLLEEQRERAQAHWRSRRLLLEHIHQSYQMPGSKEAFVRAHRSHALEDIQEAERRLRSRACRCQVHACDRYFAGILNHVAEEGRAQRAQQRAEQKKVRQRNREFAKVEASRQQLRAEPRRWLTWALDLLLRGWSATEKQLLFRGKGPGRIDARRAAETIAGLLPHSWKDEVESVWTSWTLQHRDQPADALQAVRFVLDRVMQEIQDGLVPRSTPASAILQSAAREVTYPHPPPPTLRI